MEGNSAPTVEQYALTVCLGLPPQSVAWSPSEVCWSTEVRIKQHPHHCCELQIAMSNAHVIKIFLSLWNKDYCAAQIPHVILGDPKGLHSFFFQIFFS